jgi:DNA topoisomerase I
MSKHLVIVESPAKAKSINKILGKDFIVKASLGHVRDLPQKKLGVDIENHFKPEYELISGRKKTVKELQDAAKDCDRIYLAPDPDREGEAIAWHLQAALKGRKKDAEERFYRVTYNEITAPAIRRAFEQPTRINLHRVDAQQARRVLDRIVGYQVSPLLWRRIKGGSSAGRVQSVALRLICEREAEIRAFTPEEYWVLGARVHKQVPPQDVFTIRLAKINGKDPEVPNGERAAQLRADLEKRQLQVCAINRREVTRKTRPPFITSTLQQAGSSALGFVPSRTMSVAQKLYEGVDFGDGSVGLITYMRTDSPAISKEAQAACRSFVESTFGREYVPEKPNIWKGRSSAQEAHEAIRPTDVARTPDQMARYLKPDELKLYRLIWQRFVASQMAPAKIAQRTVEFEAVPLPGATGLLEDIAYLFRATSSDIVFPGFMRATGEDQKKVKTKNEAEGGDEADDDAPIPPLEQGEKVDCDEWLTDQKFTKPPSRFSEASLVRTLEENGVGRPSTYAQIIQTLYARSYIEKEKGSLRPTDPGEKVCQFLISNLDPLFNVQFTAEMEKELDDVEDGKLEWTAMMDRFYERFLVWIKQAKSPDVDQDKATRMLELVERVQTWDAPVQRDKKTYSDEEFVRSLREQREEGKKAISMRQVEAMVKLAAKYAEQLGDAEAVIRGLEFGALWDKAHDPEELPRESTREKMKVLQEVQWEAARTVGKKTYDDGEFFTSLKQQVDGGKRLSPNQVKYLDRLVSKYADQIPNFAQLSEEWGVEKEEAVPPEKIRDLLGQLANVTEWKPPVKRGKREWSDEAFYKSLADQFEAKQTLSPKQVASLGKMVARYNKAREAAAK